MSVTASDLLKMSRSGLDDVFRSSPPGSIPNGRSNGTAIFFPGSWVGAIPRRLVRLLVWKGKFFRRGDQGSSLKNLITPFAFHLFEAKVYKDDSWFADGEAVILDYSQSSFLVSSIRDEIREVAEGLYLGQVFLGKKRVLLFMLEFPS